MAGQAEEALIGRDHRVSGTNVVLDPSGAAAPEPSCWICKTNKADSGEHKTKRSELLAVLGNPSQDEPFYYHDQAKRNRAVGSLDAKILKSPVRICSHCNNARTQPHDFAWEAMLDRLRLRRLSVGQWVRCNRIFACSTKREMINVHLFFLKLTGCMIAEAKANGHDVPIPLDPFSDAIMSGRPHAEVHLQFGRHDYGIGRSDLHVWKTDPKWKHPRWLALPAGYDRRECHLRAGRQIRTPAGSLASAFADEQKALSDCRFHVQQAGCSRTGWLCRRSGCVGDDAGAGGCCALIRSGDRGRRARRIDQSLRSCSASSPSSGTGMSEKSRLYMGICQSW